MGRRTRRSQTVPISLFSFQDVMMSIMGILVLVTLMMALDLWRTVSVVQGAPTASASATSAEDLKQLKAAEEALQKKYEETMARLSDLAGLPGDQKQEIQSRLDELGKLQQEVKELEARVASRSAKAKTDSVDKQEKRRKLESIVQMEQRTNQLKAESDELRRNPRITYLIQKKEGQGKTPLLIELSGLRVGVGSPNPRESALWIDLPDEQARMQLLLGVMSNYAKDRYYIVVLLKPSGFDFYDKVSIEIQNLGFELGTELIREEQSVLSDVLPR